MQMIMQPNIVAQPRKGVYAMSWAPGARASLARPRKELGQNAFLEGPLLAALTDFVAAGASGYLAWGLGRVHNSWSTFWWIAAALSAMKGLHDLSRMKA